MSSRSRASAGKGLVGNIKNVVQRATGDEPSTGGYQLLGAGLASTLGATLSLALSLGVSITALVLIFLTYSQIEGESSDVVAFALAAGVLGAIALGLQVISALPRMQATNPGRPLGRFMNTIVFAAYLVAGILSALVATRVSGTLQTYSIISAIFYIFISGVRFH